MTDRFYSGADLTDFGDNGWKGFKKELKLVFLGQGGANDVFIWKSFNKDYSLYIATASNPDTGLRPVTNSSQFVTNSYDVGYASYMGAVSSSERGIKDFEHAAMRYANQIKSGYDFKDNYVSADPHRLFGYPIMEHEVIKLQSSTVFWIDDLGMSQENLNRIRVHNFMAQNLADKLMQWLDENVHHAYRIYDKGVWFVDPEDAIFFKLFWAGKFD